MENEKFKTIVDSTSAEVNALIECMFHTKKEEARRFLTLMNHIVDFYLYRERENNEVCFPIIYLPNAPTWAKEVWLNFLILKLSLLYNNQKRRELSALLDRQICLDHRGRTPDGKDYKKEVRPLKDYIREKVSTLPEAANIHEGHKNIIVCNERDFATSRADKNKFLEKFYGESLEKDDNLILCLNKEANDIINELRESTRGQAGCPHVDNIFLSYTNNDACKSMSMTNVNRMNRFGTEIKNCFVFYFSQSPGPLRLHHVRKRKNHLCRLFPEIADKQRDNYEHFIVFTDEEMKYVFGQDFSDEVLGQTEHCYFPDDQSFYNEVIGNVISNTEYPILERNHFVLCLDAQQAEEYKKRELFQGIPNDDYQLSIDYQLEQAPEVIKAIHRFIADDTRVAFVLPYDVTSHEKEMVKRLFPEVRRFEFINFSNLKDRKSSKKLRSNKIVVLTYRSHYFNRPYHKYPNSFDPYLLKKGQKVLQIIQGLAFDNIYQWDKYNYETAMCGILKSAYRTCQLDRIPLPKRPAVDKPAEDETDTDEERQYTAAITSKYIFENGSSMTIPDSELIICTIDGKNRVTSMADEKQEARDHAITAVQKLDELAEILKVFMSKQTQKANHSGQVIRERYFKDGHISEEEKSSHAYLWKILLSHKVSDMGATRVYSDLMSRLKDREKIQFSSFEKWYDRMSDTMLPLQKSTQVVLMDYLGLKQPYLSIMRNKKRATKNDTRQSNGMINRFLAATLFSDVNQTTFDDIKDSDINESLQLENLGDLKARMEELNAKVNPQKISKIEY